MKSSKMEQIYSNNLKKIIKSRKEIENSFKVKIQDKKDFLLIEGNPVDEIRCLDFIQAVDLGFSIPAALNLREEGFIFRVIRIKDIAKRKNLSQVRGRVIGKNRKVMDNLEFLTNTSISLHNNLIGAIGLEEDVKKLEKALINLIAGSKHSGIYGFLEKEKSKEREGF